MATFYLVVTKPALDQILDLDKHEQHEVQRLLNIIQLDPSVDITYKMLFPTREGRETCYVTREWWIYYHVQGGTIFVTSVEKATGYIQIPH